MQAWYHEAADCHRSHWHGWLSLPPPMSPTWVWGFPTAASLQNTPTAANPWPQMPQVAGSLLELLELAAQHSPALSFSQLPCPCFLPWELLYVPLCLLFRWLSPSLCGLWAFPGPPPWATILLGQLPQYSLMILLPLPTSHNLSP